MSRSVQSPSAVVMVRPHHFASNPETAVDNAFQRRTADDPAVVAGMAMAEFDVAVATLRGRGITVHVFDDLGTSTPNSVFPNNWFSTHHGGRVAIYPMFAPNRRRERRADVIDVLKNNYRVQEVIDYSGLEHDQLYLEGTGAMVFDHVERVAYVGNSNRANPIILERFCTAFGYEPMAFDTLDEHGRPIYHTNVMMAVGTEFALVCLQAIAEPTRRAEIAARLTDSGRTVIDLSYAQVADFAGNAIELAGRDGLLLALSTRAAAALTPEQRTVIEASATLLPLAIPTIELEGGSVRCMIAGVHLAPRPMQA
ncbi:MAG: arginine deiminase-related protein [Micropruina sp.]